MTKVAASATEKLGSDDALACHHEAAMLLHAAKIGSGRTKRQRAQYSHRLWLSSASHTIACGVVYSNNPISASDSWLASVVLNTCTLATLLASFNFRVYQYVPLCVPFKKSSCLPELRQQRIRVLETCPTMCQADVPGGCARQELGMCLQ